MWTFEACPKKMGGRRSVNASTVLGGPAEVEAASSRIQKPNHQTPQEHLLTMCSTAAVASEFWRTPTASTF